MDPELIELLAMLGDPNVPQLSGMPSQAISRRKPAIKMDAKPPSGVDPAKWRKLPARPEGSLGLPPYPQPRPAQVGPISLEEAVMASVNPQGPRLFNPDAPAPIPDPMAPVPWEPSDSAQFGEFSPGQVAPGQPIHGQDFEFRRNLPPSAQAELGPFKVGPAEQEMLMAMFPDATPEEIAYIQSAFQAGIRGEPDIPEGMGGDPRLRQAIEDADAKAIAMEEQGARTREKSGTTLSKDIEQPNSMSLARGDLQVAEGLPERGVGSLRDIREPNDYLRAMGGGMPDRPGFLGRVGGTIARNPLKFAGGAVGLSTIADIINNPTGWAEGAQTLVTDPGQWASDLGSSTMAGLQYIGDEIGGIAKDAWKDIDHPRRGNPRTDISRILGLLGDVSGVNAIGQAGNKILGGIF